jgi:3-polyprenyl-4-hydroxybenzoate decarboxylase
VETNLMMSKTPYTFACQTSLQIADVTALAGVCRPISDIAAPIAGGSFKAMGMFVTPGSICSMSMSGSCEAGAKIPTSNAVPQRMALEPHRRERAAEPRNSAC